MKIETMMLTFGTVATPQRAYLYYSCDEEAKALECVKVLNLSGNRATFLFIKALDPNALKVQRPNYSRTNHPYSISFTPGKSWNKSIKTLTPKEVVKIVEQRDHGDSLSITVELTDKLMDALGPKLQRQYGNGTENAPKAVSGGLVNKQGINNPVSKVVERPAAPAPMTRSSVPNVSGDVILKKENVNFILDLLRDNPEMNSCKVPGTNVVITR